MTVEKSRLKRRLAALAVFLASAALTAVCVELAFRQRGYAAVGGEWCVLPAGLVAAQVILSRSPRHIK